MHLTIGTAGKRKAAHARSASQPCPRSHPVLARLDGAVRALTSWSDHAPTADGSSGLVHVEAVLAALGELLAVPQAAAALRAAAAACDRILDEFLVLADAYGLFESALLALKQGVAGLRAGVRLGDAAMVAASTRALRRTEKELCHLAAAMRHASRHAGALAQPDGEAAGLAEEAAAATAAASEAIFLWCATMSPHRPHVSAVLQSSNKWLAKLGVAPAARKEEPEAATVAVLERLEECIGALECENEKVFRSLVQTRVSLLNIHNPL